MSSLNNQSKVFAGDDLDQVFGVEQVEKKLAAAKIRLVEVGINFDLIQHFSSTCVYSCNNFLFTRSVLKQNVKN